MQAVHPEGRFCRTEVEVRTRFQKEGKPFSLVECHPWTGRMHQIRVHLSQEGFPIVGDKIYGPSEECYLRQIAEGWGAELESMLLLPRHALHACRLRFPFQGEWIEVVSPLPQDMSSFMEKG